MPRILKIDREAPDPAVIEKAAQILRRGGLVAFPTETVYGLGALARDEVAVRKIFAAKGRPATNPVIVHFADAAAAGECVRDWSTLATTAARVYWPGPLTMVFHAVPDVPDIVTAGGDTVGIRVPAHPVALALLTAVGEPIAAPSANASTRLSPTTADHVAESLGEKVDLILDAGPTEVGIESTVLDMTTTPLTILRPGIISAEELRITLGAVAVAGGNESGIARAPGQMRQHYAPRTPLEQAADSGATRVRELLTSPQLRVGWLCFHDDRYAVADERCVTQSLGAAPRAFAAQLYAALHALDAAKVDRIVVTAFPRDEAWAALQDRINRAAARDE